MLYLVGHVLALVAFGQGLRWGQRRSGNIIGVSAINYVVGFGLALTVFGVLSAINGIEDNTLRLGIMGLGNGLVYFLCLLIMLASYETAGVGITSAVISCGCVIPVLLSRLIGWQDNLLNTQWTAVALLPAAIFLMRPPPKGELHLSLKADLLLFAAFVTPGLSGTVHTAASRWGGGTLCGQATYATGIFAAAMICTALYAIRLGEPLNREQKRLGAFVGVVNIVATVMLVSAVGSLGVAVFFPTAGSAVILLHLLISWYLWKETLTSRQITGVAVAIAVIILANLGR